MYKDEIRTYTVRYWENGTVEVLPRRQTQLKTYITIKCGVCNHFLSSKELSAAPIGTYHCPNCNHLFEE